MVIMQQLKVTNFAVSLGRSQAEWFNWQSPTEVKQYFFKNRLIQSDA